MQAKKRTFILFIAVFATLVGLSYPYLGKNLADSKHISGITILDSVLITTDRDNLGKWTYLCNAMKKTKFLVFLLVMIATGTIGFIRCRKKDTATDGNCRYPGQVCGNASESTLRKTKFLFCN
jgi:hypothetical protein